MFFGAGASEPRNSPLPRNETCRLRALPGEGQYLFVKSIDNTRVIRKADPKARRGGLTAIGTSLVASVCLIGVMAPSAYNYIAGYELEHLRAQRERLQGENKWLDVELAKLRTPANLEQYAVESGLKKPGPRVVVYLPGDSVALNLRKK
jgi:hypothetical protein